MKSKKAFSPFHPFRSTASQKQFLEAYDRRENKWPVAFETKYIDTSYGQTFLRISGPADAPPLVLLHGIGGSSLQWMPNIEGLSASYRVYAIDSIYDNGRSVYTKSLKDESDFCIWLDELFSSLELGDAINLVGLSYGGWLTAQYALRHPHRLRKIVLLAPAGTVVSFRAAFLVRAILCAIPLRYFCRNFMYWLLDDLAKSGGAGRILLEEEVDFSYLAIRSFKTKPLVPPTILKDKELQEIATPTLFLIGDNEKICNSQDAVQRLSNISPKIKTEIIPRVGHDLTILQPQLVNRKILEFLKQ